MLTPFRVADLVDELPEDSKRFLNPPLGSAFLAASALLLTPEDIASGLICPKDRYDREEKRITIPQCFTTSFLLIILCKMFFKKGQLKVYGLVIVVI